MAQAARSARETTGNRRRHATVLARIKGERFAPRSAALDAHCARWPTGVVETPGVS